MIGISEYLLNMETVVKFNNLVRKDLPQLTNLINIEHVTLLVDANIVLGDIIYYCRDKNKKTTALKRVLEQGSMNVFAPVKLIKEVEKYIPELVAEHKLDSKRAFDLWNYYKTYFKWINSDHIILDEKSQLIEKIKSRDQNDEEYVKLYEGIKPNVFTSNDLDLMDLGVTPDDNLSMLVSLRDYSINQEIVFFYIYQGELLFGGMILAGQLVYEFIKWLIERFSNLPNKAKVIVILFLATILVTPTSKEWLKGKINSMYDSLLKKMKELVNNNMDFLNEHSEQFASSYQTAATIKDRLDTDEIKKFSNIDACILYILSRSIVPLKIEGIYRKVINYKINDIDNEKLDYYIRQSLNNNPLFENNNYGWKLKDNLD